GRDEVPARIDSDRPIHRHGRAALPALQLGTAHRLPRRQRSRRLALSAAVREPPVRSADRRRDRSPDQGTGQSRRSHGTSDFQRRRFVLTINGGGLCRRARRAYSSSDAEKAMMFGTLLFWLPAVASAVSMILLEGGIAAQPRIVPLWFAAALIAQCFWTVY